MPRIITSQNGGNKQGLILVRPTPTISDVAGRYHGRGPENSVQAATLNALSRVGAKPGIAMDELVESIRKEDYLHYGVSRSMKDQDTFMKLLVQRGLMTIDEKGGLQLTEHGRNIYGSGRVLI